MKKGFKIPVIRISGSVVVTFDQRYDYPERSEAQIKNEKNLRDISYNGFMSPKTKSKVRSYLTTWVNSIYELKKINNNLALKKLPYLTFITLTLPSVQKDTDNYLKREALTPFIELLKRKYNVWNYFWRAEAQKNNNIHFHLIIDSFIEWQLLRDEWNKLMTKLNYMDPFYDKFGHASPNSTDIHQLKNVNNPAEYLIKYVCKMDGYRKIEGRIHGCSDRVRNLNPYECELDTVALGAIKELKNSKKVKFVEEPEYQIFLVERNAFYGPNWKKLKIRESRYLISIAADLYTNKEASEIEIAQAAALTHYEEESKKYEQMSLCFESELGCSRAMLES